MTTITVGVGKDYFNINDAYLASCHDDIILIDEGHYNETLFMEDKIVNLLGNTEYSEEGSVVISGTTDQGILRTSYSGTSTTIYIENIKFNPNTSIDFDQLIKFDNTFGRSSELDVVFNKCSFDTTTLPNNTRVFDFDYEGNISKWSLMSGEWTGNENDYGNLYIDCELNNFRAPKDYLFDNDIIDNIYIGTFGNDVGNKLFHGAISEFRISSVSRSNAWLKTDYYNFNNDLISFGETQTSGINWLSDWAYRIPIIVDHTKIEEDLIYYPIAINLNYGTTTSGIFNEIGIDSKKITITQSNGQTQLYGEIEYWNGTTCSGAIWASSQGLTISGFQDTQLYLYYDSSKSDNTTYIGDTGDTSAQNVWDSNFEFVSHMIPYEPSNIFEEFPDDARNLGSNHNGTVGANVEGNPIDNGDYYSFDGKFDGLYYNNDYGDESEIEILTKVKIKNKNKGWKWSTEFDSYMLDFKGPNDYIDITNINHDIGTGDFTISLWANPYSVGDLDTFMELTHYNTGLLFRPRNSVVQVYISGSHYDFPYTRTANKWEFYTLVRESGTVTLYVNAIEIGSTTLTGNIANGRMYIGSSLHTTGQVWDGMLSEYRIWNVARTQQEIQDNMYKRLNGDETGLIVYYKLDEGSGIIAYDSAGVNDGSIKKNTAQVIWKSGGGALGLAVGIDSSSNLGIFTNGSSITISGTEYSSDTIYYIHGKRDGVFLYDEYKNLVASNAGILTDENGSNQESIGFAYNDSPITSNNGNIEYFEGDIYFVNIYSKDTRNLILDSTSNLSKGLVFNCELDIDADNYGMYFDGSSDYIKVYSSGTSNFCNFPLTYQVEFIPHSFSDCSILSVGTSPVDRGMDLGINSLGDYYMNFINGDGVGNVDRELISLQDTSLHSFKLKNCKISYKENYFCNEDSYRVHESIIENTLVNHCLHGVTTSEGTFNLFNEIDVAIEDYYEYGPKYGANILPIPSKYYFHGNVCQDGSYAERELRIFRQDNDVFIGSTVSSGINGEYYIETSYGGFHYVICLDDEVNPYYNDLIRTKCLPANL